MQTRTTTYKEVAELLVQIADENPNFIYGKRPTPEGRGTCMYVWKGRCDCLIGHLFVRLGVPLEFLEQFEGHPARKVWTALVAHGFLACPVEDHGPISDLVEQVQGRQDRCYSWGVAAEPARRALQRT